MIDESLDSGQKAVLIAAAFSKGENEKGQAMMDALTLREMVEVGQHLQELIQRRDDDRRR